MVLTLHRTLVRLLNIWGIKYKYFQTDEFKGGFKVGYYSKNRKQTVQTVDLLCFYIQPMVLRKPRIRNTTNQNCQYFSNHLLWGAYVDTVLSINFVL